MVGGIAPLRVEQLDARTDEVQLACEIPSEERAHPPAEREHSPARIGEQVHHRLEVVLGHHVEAGAEAVLDTSRTPPAASTRSGSPGRRQLVPSEWGAQALLQLLPE